MVLQINEVLVKHGLDARVIAYVKDEGVISQPWPKFWLPLFHVKGWGFGTYICEFILGACYV
jgi:hypothetical protein